MCVFPKEQSIIQSYLFQHEYGDSGFSCKEWIQRVLKSIPQKFQVISTKVAPTTLSLR